MCFGKAMVTADKGTYTPYLLANFCGNRGKWGSKRSLHQTNVWMSAQYEFTQGVLLPFTRHWIRWASVNEHTLDVDKKWVITKPLVVEHLPTGLFAVHISSLVKCQGKSLAHVLTGLFVLLLLSSQSSLCALDLDPLSHTCLASLFSQSVTCPLETDSTTVFSYCTDSL